MKRWPVAAMIASVVALSGASRARALDHIKINYVEPAPYYAPLFLAIDKGYFAEDGIEAELVQAGGGVATPALIAGDLDFSTSGSVAISAILKGAKLRVLFVTSDRPAFEVWAQPEIKTFEDLKGKQVGIISRGDTSEIAFRYYLSNHKLPGDFVAYTPLGTGTARIAGMVSGTYAAALLGVNEMEELKATGKFERLHLLADLTKDVRMVFSGLAARDATIAEKPDLVRRVLRGILKGMTLTKASRADAIAAMVAHGASDAKQAAAQYDASVALFDPTGTTSLQNENVELQLRGDLLGVPRAQLKKSAEVFDFSFVEKAAAALQAENWRPAIGRN
ncbi:MAG TPA: ABC transporter substrate-binding protein [Stellaceae bacterium]|nr:ABC transporter substrate-binding protein [Stellaceae bacterium]